MADKPSPSAAQLQSQVTIADAARAPVLYFEGVMTFGFAVPGVLNLLLATNLILPTTGGQVINVATAVAHLRCNEAAARSLRDAIDKAFLAATPTEGGTN